MVAIAFVVLAVLAPSGCGVVAFRRQAQVPVIAVAFTLQFFGAIALALGLLAWAFNGYKEDEGTRPVESLQVATALLIAAVVATAVAWLLALRRRGSR